MKFLAILKAAGKAVLGLSSNPIVRSALAALPYGALISDVIAAVSDAQEQIPAAGAGESRKVHALRILQIMAPRIVADFERTAGREVIDEDRLALGIAQMQEAVVSINKSFGLLPSIEAKP